MESPVVIDKPPEYHGNARTNERGFPFDEEEGSGAWSSLAARHPDIAARLRQRPATWARKRRPSSQDATDDFGESFAGFDRFPFDDIPPEFREHFPTHWNRRFSERDEPEQAAPAQTSQAPHSPQPSPAQPAPAPQQSSAATQTEPAPDPAHALPQYGLRNTVDLGRRSAADPSLVDDERAARAMSAPPAAPPAPDHADPPHPSNVRHIPIFVEGRDEPVINKNVDHGTHFGDAKPAPPHQHPHHNVDREQFYDDGPAFHPPPNFSRAFGTPFSKGFRQGPQPFVQQKVYPQTAFARGASPQRSNSPKPPSPAQHPHADDPRPHHPTPPPPAAARHQTPPPPPPPPPAPQQQQQPQPKPQEKPAPAANDPITLILNIQTDVLNLMSEVENFTGTKKDKKYLFLDEMLTRNLIKLDNIETDGKENIRQARKEAIKCIQKCIAVLEAKADKGSGAAAEAATAEGAAATENGEAEISEAPQEATPEAAVEQPSEETQEKEIRPQESEPPAPAADAKPDAPAPDSSPKQTGKSKKRDKSKDNKDKDTNDSNKETEKDQMQVDAKGDAPMDVDGATSQ